MPYYLDPDEVAKKKKALEKQGQPKIITDIEHSAKAIDAMHLDDEGRVDRSGKCPTCGK